MRAHGVCEGAATARRHFLYFLAIPPQEMKPYFVLFYRRYY